MVLNIETFDWPTGVHHLQLDAIGVAGRSTGHRNLAIKIRGRQDRLKVMVEDSGYTVVLCYIGIAGPDVSEDRVAMRVSQGGHDVPSEKLQSRYPRTLDNLTLVTGDVCCRLFGEARLADWRG